MIKLTGTPEGIQVEIHGNHFIINEDLTITEINIGLNAKIVNYDSYMEYPPPIFDYRNDESIFNDPDVVK